VLRQSSVALILIQEVILLCYWNPE